MSVIITSIKSRKFMSCIFKNTKLANITENNSLTGWFPMGITQLLITYFSISYISAFMQMIWKKEMQVKKQVMQDSFWKLFFVFLISKCRIIRFTDLFVKKFNVWIDADVLNTLCWSSEQSYSGVSCLRHR
jgi:hypothetical protein